MVGVKIAPTPPVLRSHAPEDRVRQAVEDARILYPHVVAVCGLFGKRFQDTVSGPHANPRWHYYLLVLTYAIAYSELDNPSFVRNFAAIDIAQSPLAQPVESFRDFMGRLPKIVRMIT